MTIALDPADARNAVIADIAQAPRNAQGRVEAIADVVILRPADAARGNGTMLLEVPNRGRPLAIPGLPYSGMHMPAAEFDRNAATPREIARYPVFVPRADTDGMTIAGIRLPVIEAPRATYTGWNPRAEGYGPGVLCPLQGAVVPLAPTRAARLASGDPRPSLEERYASPADYVAGVRAAAMVEAATAGRLAR